MNCEYCKYDEICEDKEYWRRKGFCEDFKPAKWSVAKKKYEKELQEVGERKRKEK